MQDLIDLHSPVPSVFHASQPAVIYRPSPVQSRYVPAEPHDGSFDSIATAALITARRAQVTLDSTLLDAAKAQVGELTNHLKFAKPSSAGASYFTAMSQKHDDFVRLSRFREAEAECKSVTTFFNSLHAVSHEISESSKKGRSRLPDFDKIWERVFTLSSLAHSMRVQMPVKDPIFEETQSAVTRGRIATLHSGVYHAESRGAAKQQIKAVLETVGKSGWGPLKKAAIALNDLKALGPHSFGDNSDFTSDELYTKLRNALFLHHKTRNESHSQIGTVQLMVRWIISRIEYLEACSSRSLMTPMQEARAFHPIDQALNEYRSYEKKIQSLRSNLELDSPSEWKRALPVSYAELQHKRSALVQGGP